MVPTASEVVQVRRAVANGSPIDATSSNEEESCADVFGSSNKKEEDKNEDVLTVQNGETLLINPDLIREVRRHLFNLVVHVVKYLCRLRNPDFIRYIKFQEEELRLKNEKKEAAEAKAKVDEDDLTPQQRYKKLCDLLSKSKFYSNFLLEKMEKEDEESKKLKNKNLAGRKTKKDTVEEQVPHMLMM